MAYVEPRSEDPRRAREEERRLLVQEWRKLNRAATAVALLTSPAFLAYLHHTSGWSLGASLLVTVFAVAAFRGFVDVVVRKLIPSASLYGAERDLVEEDVIARRRHWYWRKKFRRLAFWASLFGVIVLAVMIAGSLFGDPRTVGEAVTDVGNAFVGFLPALLGLGLQLPIFFLINILILFGPLLFFGVQQIKGYEPGDADWGVRLADVRGQAEAKEEITRIVSLWQSGEDFERAGGKRERGVLFLGAPGTGKTMLSKAIATGFNCPFVTIPGSGFAQTFIGMDALVVRFMARKAKKLAAKWGGQCIVFIDEIDAVGMRRASLGGGGVGGFAQPVGPGSFHDFCFYGPFGALTPTGDLVLESRAWRERLFEARAPQPLAPAPPFLARIGDAVQRFMFPGGMGMGGGLALNQLLVVMDGIDDPPFSKRFLTNRFNTFLDALYIVPRRIGSVSLRMSPPRPRKEEIYFIGACNVPIEMLDPALTRPGRMGRHVWFRTPTKDDRKDIFDLYLDRVDHDPDLDTPKRRDELARITNGYSPAMIEQVTSMALTYAHAEGRRHFSWPDIVEAMTTIESGTAVGVEYVPAETRAVAIHEAGHAVCSHVYMKDVLSTRLSIRKRGGSLGHHQAIEKEERFSSWRSEEVGKLVWTLGAMAAERVFYGENSTGVGGDVMSATARAAWMVGSCAMAPERIDLDGRFATEEDEEAEREKLAKRFEQIGTQIMRRAGGGGPFEADPLAGVLADRDKRAAVAQLLGQAYLTAHLLILHNRDKVDRIAEVLVERRELHGDEVVELLDDLGLEQPEIDLLDDATWPKL